MQIRISKDDIKEGLREEFGRDPTAAEIKDFETYLEMDVGKKMLYNSVSEYVNEQYNKALSKDKRRNVAFALIILQRRIASSTYALLRSLTRRRERLQGLMDIALRAL